MAHLRALGVKDPQNWPQAKIAATEQGWSVRLCNPLCPLAFAFVPMLMHSSPCTRTELQCFLRVQPIGDAAQELAAEYICVAHDIMSRSNHAVFVTHNDFQGTTSNDTTGLIPVWTGMPSCLPPNAANVHTPRVHMPGILSHNSCKTTDKW